MKRCPQCGSTKLETTAHVVERWWMDGDNYVETVDCEGVAHYPDNEDLWACRDCEYEAAGIEFEEE